MHDAAATTLDLVQLILLKKPAKTVCSGLIAPAE